MRPPKTPEKPPQVSRVRLAVAVVLMSAAVGASLAADTLIMRDGTRVRGELIAVRNSPTNPGRPMPNRPAAALIGKVGSGDDIFFIGDDTAAIRVRNAGRLYLGVNDDVLNDNRGNFRVTVYY